FICLPVAVFFFLADGQFWLLIPLIFLKTENMGYKIMGKYDKIHSLCEFSYRTPRRMNSCFRSSAG
ncbi:hypothetical protein, partial [Bilifractor porci]|uniref:hypothetical protein n=1 Tax=Bilifractor porci TaxID=2606636 RepID=UPI00197C0F3D